MTINITGRKTTIKDSFREEAEREMTRFDRLFDDDASAHITVSNEGGRETVEITIRSGGMIFRAEKTTELQAVAGPGRRPAVPSDRKE